MRGVLEKTPPRVSGVLHLIASRLAVWASGAAVAAEVRRQSAVSAALMRTRLQKKAVAARPGEFVPEFFFRINRNYVGGGGKRRRSLLNVLESTGVV